jgi:hypothetical protein
LTACSDNSGGHDGDRVGMKELRDQVVYDGGGGDGDTEDE